jgi:curved DNA-binding protein CbpA
MEHHVESLLSSCLEWPDGEVSFDDGRPALDGETTVRLSPIQQILRHARRFPASIDALRLKIGPPNLRPVGTPAMASLAASLEPGGALGYALAQAQGALSVGEIAIASPAGEEPTLRAIYGLLLAGVIEPAAAHAAERRIAPGQREPALTRAEVEARLALAHDADHYTTLGLERTASMDRIRDAYYALARRYHPDRFRSGAIQNLLPRVERYFTQVTGAYNTLQHIDRRAEYDAYIEGASSASETSRGTDTAYLARQNFLRGRQLAERKRLAEALTFLENAVRLDAGVAEYHLDLGLLLARSPRRRAEAESELIAAAGLDPSIVAAYLGLGQLYERAGRRPEAARMFREVLRWDPGHAEASSLLAALGTVEPEAGNAQFLRKVLGS